MRVLFLKDVPGSGRRGDIKNVADGYAHNFLFPRKLAMPASEGQAKAIKKNDAEISEKHKITENMLSEEIKSLEGIVLNFSDQASPQGHLFAGLHEKDIFAELQKIKKLRFVAPDMISLDKAIKKVGEHKAIVRSGKVKATLKIVVTAQN